MAAAPGKGSSRAASFWARLGSTVLLWGIVVGVFVSGRYWALALLVSVLGLLGSVEFALLTKRAPGRECRWWGVLVSAGFLAYMAMNPAEFPPPEAHMEGVNVHLMAVVCFLAVTLSDYLIYWLGKKFGYRILALSMA